LIPQTSAVFPILTNDDPCAVVIEPTREARSEIS
jgi:hypothetical protein